MVGDFLKGFKKTYLLAVAAIFAMPAILAAYSGALQGVVKNSSGAPVSGAMVKMKNAERRLTFMVVTQDGGRYSVKTLPPGNYVVQGVGNGMQSKWSAATEVAEGKAASVDVALTDQQAAALPNAWPGRQPGDMGGEGGSDNKPLNLPEGEGKKIAMSKCGVCHPPSRIVGYQADKQRWKDTLEDMRMYMQGSKLGMSMSDKEAATMLDYLVKNFAEGEGGRAVSKKPDPNSRLPRTLLKGDATKYIAVEFEIPNAETEPHEVTVDSEGNGWVSQRRGGKLGKLDPRTLTYTEISPPPAPSKSVQLNAIWAGPNNKLWFMDVGPNRRWLTYDTKSREFSTYNMTTKLRTGAAGGNTMRQHPNGTVWFNAIGNNTVIRLDPKTGEFTGFEVPSGVKAGKSASPYGMAIAGDGHIWVAENAMDKLAKVDPVTGKMEEFEIPVKGAVPRKGGPDANGDVWFGLHGAGKIMKIDQKTNKMTVYQPPTENSGTYAISVDMKHNLVWVAQQMADKIARFDPKTETWTEYPLANAEEDHRRIEVDQSNPNRVWWSGDLSNRMGFVEVLQN